MYTASRDWLRRHRRKFAISFGIIGITYLAAQYILNKIIETRDRLSSERISRENLRRRFQQNQEDCTYTVLALLPTLNENVTKALPVEDISDSLRQQRAEKLGRSTQSEFAPSEISAAVGASTPSQGEEHASDLGGSYGRVSQFGLQSTVSLESSEGSARKTKAQMWDDLKISSFTRAFTMIYSVSLLSLFIRIQLNILGRKNYLSSVVAMANPTAQDASMISLENRDDDRGDVNANNDFEINRRYLTFSWWLLHRGWAQIKSQVEDAVAEAFRSLNPRDDISVAQFSELVVAVRKSVEGATEEDRRHKQWLPYLLPPRDQETFVLRESDFPTDSPLPSPSDSSSPFVDPLRRLLDESSDLIDSPTASTIITLLLDASFSYLTDVELRLKAFKIAPQTPLDPSQRVTEILTDTNSQGGDSVAWFDPLATKARLASIMAAATREYHVIASGEANPYVDALEGVKELEAFAAVVYSNNFEVESGLLNVDEDERDGMHKRSVSLEAEGHMERVWSAAQRTQPSHFRGQGQQGYISGAWNYVRSWL